MVTLTAPHGAHQCYYISRLMAGKPPDAKIARTERFVKELLTILC